MVEVMHALGVDAMTAHWEFTYGTERVNEIVEQLQFPLLAGNIFDEEWMEPAFKAYELFERGDRKSVVEGKSVSVRVDRVGRGIIKKKKNTKHNNNENTYRKKL